MMILMTSFSAGSRNSLSTREFGAEVRQCILEKLELGENLVLDFGKQNVSPSFADECIGLIVQDLGFERVKKNIKLINLSDSAKSIIKHVISKRVGSRSEAA